MLYYIILPKLVVLMELNGEHYILHTHIADRSFILFCHRKDKDTITSFFVIDRTCGMLIASGIYQTECLK